MFLSLSITVFVRLVIIKRFLYNIHNLLLICFVLQLSVCLYLCRSLCVCVSLCLSLCVCVSVCVSLCLSVCLSVSLCLCLSLSLCVCLSLCLSVSVSLSFSLCEMCVYVGGGGGVRGCVRACVRACVCVCMRERTCCSASAGQTMGENLCSGLGFTALKADLSYLLLICSISDSTPAAQFHSVCTFFSC